MRVWVYISAWRLVEDRLYDTGSQIPFSGTETGVRRVDIFPVQRAPLGRPEKVEAEIFTVEVTDEVPRVGDDPSPTLSPLALFGSRYQTYIHREVLNVQPGLSDSVTIILQPRNPPPTLYVRDGSTYPN